MSPLVDDTRTPEQIVRDWAANGHDVELRSKVLHEGNMVQLELRCADIKLTNYSFPANVDRTWRQMIENIRANSWGTRDCPDLPKPKRDQGSY